MSGSLYHCVEEESSVRGAYRGNGYIDMSTGAIIEQEIDDVELHHAVVDVSNVLRANSAAGHLRPGTGIHAMIRAPDGFDQRRSGSVAKAAFQLPAFGTWGFLRRMAS